MSAGVVCFLLTGLVTTLYVIASSDWWRRRQERAELLHAAEMEMLAAQAEAELAAVREVNE